MPRPIRFCAHALIVLVFVVSLVTAAVLIGCTAEQWGAAVHTAHAASTQPAAHAAAALIPYGEIVLPVVTLVLGYLARHYQPKRKSA